MRDLASFVRHYAAVGGPRLFGVVGLDLVLSGMTGAGLLLILPLLGLLGVGGASATGPLWSAVAQSFEWLGLPMTLSVGLGLFACLVGLRATLAWRRATWQVEVEQSFQAGLRNRLYDTLAAADLSRVQRMRSSEFISSIQSEIRRAQQTANALLLLVSQALSLLAHFAAAMLISPVMTLLALVAGATAVVLLLPAVRRSRALGASEIRIRTSMVTNLMDHVQGLRAARALGLTERFIHDYHALSDRSAAVNVRLTRLAAASTLAFELTAVALTAGIVWVSLTVLHVDAARFLVLLLIFLRVFPAIGRFQSEMQQFAALLPSFRHYLDLIGELSRHRRPEATASGAGRLILRSVIELRGASFHHGPGESSVVGPISLRIQRGEWVALAGHSGAGKSTLVDLVAGLLAPTAGSLCVDGVPLDDASRMMWVREVALVPQDGFMLHGTIRDNLRCVRPEADDAAVWRVLDAVGARGFVESRSEGLGATVGERGAALSGGERQRLSIARALLREPQLLVLDEPTNSLDAASVAALLETLGRLAGGTTLLVVSHDLRVLNCSGRVVYLESGRLVDSSVGSGNVRA